jgi:ketosteroid isomerase-like protein
MAEEHVKYLTGVYERWAQGDFTMDPPYPAEMTLVLEPEFPEAGTYTGPEGIATYMQSFLEPWERLTMVAEEMVDGGDKVLVRVTQSGSGTGSGIPVELRYFHLWTFDGSKPVRLESIMQEPDAMARLTDQP